MVVAFVAPRCIWGVKIRPIRVKFYKVLDISGIKTPQEFTISDPQRNWGQRKAVENQPGTG
jgi:hypothetical protein